MSGTSLLKALGQTPCNLTSNHDVLDTIDHVQQCLAYSMHHCAGLERFFSNRSLYQLITDKAAEIDHEVNPFNDVATMYIDNDSISLVVTLH